MKINCNKPQLSAVISNYPDSYFFDFELGEISKATLKNIVKVGLTVQNLFCFIEMPKSILTEFVDKSLPKSFVPALIGPGGGVIEEQRRFYKDYLFYKENSENIIFIVNCKDLYSENSAGNFTSEQMYLFFDYFCKGVDYANLYPESEYYTKIENEY
jgi:hypothetical protein